MRWDRIGVIVFCLVFWFGCYLFYQKHNVWTDDYAELKARDEVRLKMKASNPFVTQSASEIMGGE